MKDITISKRLQEILIDLIQEELDFNSDEIDPAYSTGDVALMENLLNELGE